MKKYLIILACLIPTLSFAAGVDSGKTRAKPKTTFSQEQNSGLRIGGFQENQLSSSKNETDLPLPDKKLARGFERLPKTDAFGDELGDEFLFYKATLSSAQKSVYDEIYKALMNQQSSVNLVNRIQESQIAEIISAVFFDNPEIFYWAGNTSWCYNSNGVVTSLNFQFLFDENELQDEISYFQSMSLPILFYASLLDDDMAKIKYIHDYICLSTEYDYETYNAGLTAEKRILQTAYSSIVQYKTVCAGYSKAMAYYL